VAVKTGPKRKEFRLELAGVEHRMQRPCVRCVRQGLGNVYVVRLTGQVSFRVPIRAGGATRIIVEARCDGCRNLFWSHAIARELNVRV
jgi:hypothetical protein